MTIVSEDALDRIKELRKAAELNQFDTTKALGLALRGIDSALAVLEQIRDSNKGGRRGSVILTRTP